MEQTNDEILTMKEDSNNCDNNFDNNFDNNSDNKSDKDIVVDCDFPSKTSKYNVIFSSIYIYIRDRLLLYQQLLFEVIRLIINL